jgi:hypothetical protein
MTDEMTIKNQVRNQMQKEAYQYCDNFCRMSALECGSRYGDVNKCKELQGYFKRQRKEYARMHGLME